MGYGEVRLHELPYLAATARESFPRYAVFYSGDQASVVGGRSSVLVTTMTRGCFTSCLMDVRCAECSWYR